jgi:tetratricopeptide (TPR) repeat protein
MQEFVQQVSALAEHLDAFPDILVGQAEAELLSLLGWAGWYLSQVSDTSRAIPLDERVLTDSERVLGPDHPDTRTSRNNLAGAYQLAGRLDDAITHYEQNLVDADRIVGPDHPKTLSTRNNLAATYAAAGRLDEAITLHERTLADNLRVLGVPRGFRTVHPLGWMSGKVK